MPASYDMAKRAAITLVNELGLSIRGRAFYHPVFSADLIAARKAFPGVRWRDRRWWRRRGFGCDKEIIFDRRRIDDYLDDLTRYILVERMNLRYRAVMIEKSVFARYCGAGANVVPVLAVTRRSAFLPAPRPDALRDLSDLQARLRRGDRFVFKPIEGGGGKGVSRLRCDRDADAVLIDGSPIAPDELVAFLSRVARGIIQPEVGPSGYSAEIYPDALNTMRIVTMICPTTSMPFIAAASHKFGTLRSGVVDNWKRGGLLCRIDIESGELGPGFLYPTERDGMVPLKAHPDTGSVVQGFTVPNWHGLVEQILKVALDVDFLPMIGWDVAWSGSEITIVEGNTNPDLILSQCFDPILANPRARDFYKHHGVI